MRRLLVVYNPRSSRYVDVRRDVLDRVKELNGYMVGKFEVKKVDIEENIADLSKILKDGDLVISAGGDATGVISANGVLKSKKDVTLAVLPYGNFNDFACTLKAKTIDDVLGKKAKEVKYYPLEIYVDGEFFRYATCYVTIGMMAEAVYIYDQPKMRRKLKKSFGRNITSYTVLIKWYFKNRHKKIFLPEFYLNGKRQDRRTSDYVAMNGVAMARVMRGRIDYLDKKIFRREVGRLTSFWELFKIMYKSILIRIPGKETTGDILEFVQHSTVELQAEGEHKKFKNISKIEVKKGKRCLKVITI